MSPVKDEWISQDSRLLMYEPNAHLENTWLAAHAGSPDLSIYKSIKLEKRKWEWLSLQLLKEFAGISGEIFYRHNGKPFIAGENHISISHGEGIAGLLISRKNAGLDIQKPDEKLEHIKNKFCNADELSESDKSASPLEYLTIIWCAKEAIFKVFGENVHFARDIRISPFHLEADQLDAMCTRNGTSVKFRLKTFVLKGHRVVCTL